MRAQRAPCHERVAAFLACSRRDQALYGAKARTTGTCSLSRMPGCVPLVFVVSFASCSAVNHMKHERPARSRPRRAEVTLGTIDGADRRVAPLAKSHPRIALRWHPTKNGALTPRDVTADGTEPVWWQCSKRGHAWRSSVRARVLGSFRCPLCARSGVRGQNTLARRRPDLVEQWHWKRNGDLSPDDVNHTSKTPVWWKCRVKRDHEWQVAISSRTMYPTAGCPFCYGNRTARSNSLGTCKTARGRRLQREFHPTKNGKLTVFDVQPGTARKLWWSCEKGHAWQASGTSRFHLGRDCVECSSWHANRAESLATVLPELAKEWHPTKNRPLTPRDVTRSSELRVWWKCSDNPEHVWQTQLLTRTNARARCPFCTGRLATSKTSLAALHPALAKQWHPTRNGDLTPSDVRPGSRKRAWWKCPKGPDHEWQAAIGNRTSRSATGCPCCAGRQLSTTNNLAVKVPVVARQWHPSRNGKLTPRDVVAGSHKVVWWRCSKAPDHEWACQISSRSAKGGGCPFCTGRKTAFSDSVAGRFPRLAREWNHARNGATKPSDVHAGSKQRVWWICPRKHDWACPANDRTLRGRACPACAEGLQR